MPFHRTNVVGTLPVRSYADTYTAAVARSSTTEAVVLRSFRFGEADRVLHVYTSEHGRVGAVAKGVRKTKSRFGGRLEPFSHVELVLHRGQGELQTVTGASLVRAHDRVRADPYRLQVGLIGLEAMLRLFTEQERNERAFLALTRFLDALDASDSLAPARPALDPVVLSFQLKLLWLSGYLPHLDTCVECGRPDALVAYVPSTGGVVCADCDPGGLELSAAGIQGIRALVHAPMADARSLTRGEAARRETLGVLTATYEQHGGFRLKTTTW
jgi:DNA repair protein RecO (recombination protein O)